MKFSELIYLLSLVKIININKNLSNIIDKIDIPKEEIIRFKFKNRDIIINNRINDISKIKLFENNILNVFIIFHFDKNNIQIDDKNNLSKFIYNNNDDNDRYFSKDFLTSINIDIKSQTNVLNETKDFQ